METRSVLTRLQSSGTDVVKLLQPVMFYTYIDRDHHESHEVTTLFLLHFYNLIIPQVLTRGGRTRDMPNIHYRDNSYKVMHFCFATDVKVDGLLLEKVILFL